MRFSDSGSSAGTTDVITCNQGGRGYMCLPCPLYVHCAALCSEKAQVMSQGYVTGLGMPMVANTSMGPETWIFWT